MDHEASSALAPCVKRMVRLASLPVKRNSLWVRCTECCVLSRIPTGNPVVEGGRAKKNQPTNTDTIAYAMMHVDSLLYWGSCSLQSCLASCGSYSQLNGTHPIWVGLEATVQFQFHPLMLHAVESSISVFSTDID